MGVESEIYVVIQHFIMFECLMGSQGFLHEGRLCERFP